MTIIPADKRYPYSYIGRKPCGCLVACYIDQSADGQAARKNLARVLAEWAERGLTIERVTHDVVRAEFVADSKCPHQPEARQKALF